VKIGLVSPYDYSFPGGVVNHISYLAHYFIHWGHDVKVIAPSLRKGTQYFDEEVTNVGRPLPIPFGGSVARVPISPWLPVQVGKILAKENFDILHLHEPFTPMLCLSTLLKSSCINVGTFHACYNKSLSYWVGKPILKQWLPRLHGKIAVSKPALDYVSRYLPDDYRIIPNGIDIERFSPDGPQREEFADDKLNILFVGRLEKRKGLDYLLRACAQVKKHFTNFRLIVVGPGTPVVATDIEGYASVLTHGEEGLLVPPRDEEALAQALLSLLNDKSLRHQMGAKGRINAEKYSWANVAQQVMDYYTSLLS